MRSLSNDVIGCGLYVQWFETSLDGCQRIIIALVFLICEREREYDRLPFDPVIIVSQDEAVYSTVFNKH